MADRSWFFASNGTQHGPYPEIQLGEFVASGAVTGDTLVWTEGMAVWQRAGDVPGLLSKGESQAKLSDGAAAAWPASPPAGHDTAPGKRTPGERIQGLEISLGMLARMYWLFLWRSALGAVLIGFVLGFIIGFALTALGGTLPQVRMVGGWVGALGGLIWSGYVLKMALKKHYSDFRIVLVPRDAELD